MKFKLIGVVVIFGMLSYSTMIRAVTIDWSGVILGGTFPNFSFSDTTLGTVSVSYSDTTEKFGIDDQFGGVDNLLVGNVSAQSLAIEWTNPITSMDLSLWDIDAIPGTVGENVVISSSAAISLVSLHPTDTWNSSTLTLASLFGVPNNNSLTDNFSQFNFFDPAGFTSISFDFSVASGTGTLGIGDFQDLAPIPIPAAGWLFGTALLGLLALGRRKFMVAK